MELKVKFPDLPLLCDPSHITGKRELIQQVCQKAMDLDYNGLIIETHPDPDKALSDGPNAWPLHLMENLLSMLKEIDKQVKREALIEDSLCI